MSRASGYVIFKDRTKRFCMYDGGIDRIENQTYPIIEEARTNYRTYPSAPRCEHDEQNVELFTDYGGGITWEGKCCSKCGWITQGNDPYADNEDSFGFMSWLADARD